MASPKAIAPLTLDIARHFPIERLIEARAINLRGGIERVGPCPLCGGRDRFGINIRKQVWVCRGCRKGGDAIALLQFLDGCDFSTACATLIGEASNAEKIYVAGEQRSRAVDYELKQRNKAKRLWRASRPANGTLVDVYLRGKRGVSVPLGATVRFLPPLNPSHHPAMLIPFGLPGEPEPGVLCIGEDAITAVQLTLLRPNGTDKADIERPKFTVGSPAGMPMVLAPMNDLLGLAICEGVEDALSAHQATGLGAWASGGGSFMPKIAEAVPDCTEVVTVYMHNDEAGERGAYELATSLGRRGIEVRLEGGLSA